MKRTLMDIVQEKPWMGWAIFLGTIVVVFLIGLLAASIMERRGEADLIVQAKPIADWEPRNEVWGENYPREFETYAATADTSFLSKHGGNGISSFGRKSHGRITSFRYYSRNAPTARLLLSGGRCRPDAGQTALLSP